ncbi:DUF6174 domain-containing protein [Streptomyces sp. G45]|uniref:DUF6174 domain-containing protein n=1 Tax=Streptomyces sp. G45 TaxID=3406627 RepID=UPI003C2659E4
MTLVRHRHRHRPRATAAAAVALCTLALATACGDDTPSARTKPDPAPTRAPWEEPAAYAYTLTSTRGERPLIGTFRVTVQGGKVVKAVGLDASGRRVVKRSPEHIPTLSGLLREMEAARRGDAETVTARYAPDGHPVRIFIDWEKAALDDEAAYAVSAYEPMPYRLARPETATRTSGG